MFAIQDCVRHSREGGRRNFYSTSSKVLSSGWYQFDYDTALHKTCFVVLHPRQFFRIVPWWSALTPVRDCILLHVQDNTTRSVKLWYDLFWFTEVHLHINSTVARKQVGTDVPNRSGRNYTRNWISAPARFLLSVTEPVGPHYHSTLLKSSISWKKPSYSSRNRRPSPFSKGSKGLPAKPQPNWSPCTPFFALYTTT